MFHHDLELDHQPPTREAMIPEMSRSYKLLLSSLGEDPERPGLLKTPERAAKAMLFFTKGYDQSLEGKLLLLLNIHLYHFYISLEHLITELFLSLILSFNLSRILI